GRQERSPVVGGPGRAARAITSWLPRLAGGARLVIQLVQGGTAMAIDTFIAYVGVYNDPGDADADYQLVKDLHTKAGLIDAYDAAVIERRGGPQSERPPKNRTPP